MTSSKRHGLSPFIGAGFGRMEAAYQGTWCSFPGMQIYDRKVAKRDEVSRQVLHLWEGGSGLLLLGYTEVT